MRKTFIKETPFYQFHLLQKFSDQIGHAVFSRHGGFSGAPYDALNVRFGIGDKQRDVVKNRRLICKVLDLEEGRLVSANQTHSKNVQVVDEEFLASSKESGSEFEVDDMDALVTDLENVGLMIQVADCQALLLYDPVKRVVAAVHAGWKGLVQDVSGATVEVMVKKFGADPARILVGIAPSLGPCCAFFTNPENELPGSFAKYIDKQKRVDLWSYSLDQLQTHGISMNNIELAKVCTQCGKGGGKGAKGNFFSFRGQHGITGRFGVAIYLRSVGSL